MKFQAFIIVNMISAAVVTERIEDADSSSYLGKKSFIFFIVKIF